MPAESCTGLAAGGELWARQSVIHLVGDVALEDADDLGLGVNVPWRAASKG